MKKMLLLGLLLPVIVNAQLDSVLSGVYHWEKPNTPAAEDMNTAILFEGMVYDMQWMKVSAFELGSSAKERLMMVPEDEEQIIILKKGKLDVNLKDQETLLIPGSVIVLMPGEKISLKNLSEPCEFYYFQYKSKLPVDADRGEKAGGSFIKDFSKIEFKPHDKGGIRNYFERPTAMGKRLEMHVSTLDAGLKSHDPHTHRAEEIVLMIEGDSEMQIGQEFYKGKAGDLYYLESNVLHAIRNTGNSPCMYFAFQFE